MWSIPRKPPQTKNHPVSKTHHLRESGKTPPIIAMNLKPLDSRVRGNDKGERE